MQRTSSSRHLSAWSLLALFGAGALACTAETSYGSREDEKRVKPGGTDRPGTLTVVAPPGATGVEPTEVIVGSQRVNLGEPAGPLGVGNQSFRLETNGGAFFQNAQANAMIEADKPTIITAALVGVNAMAGPRTLGLGELNSSMNITIQMGNATAGHVKPTADGSQLLPLVEGAYEINFGFFATDGVAVEIASGSTKVVTLTDPAGRRVTRVRAPTRELPDATCDDSFQARPWTISLKGQPTPWHTVAVKDGEELDLGISWRNEGKQYTLQPPMLSSPIEVPLGDRGTVKTWQIGRIDVDDVTINGGSTVVGTYQVFVANAEGARVGGNLLKCAPKTNSGIDIPHGHYRVEVTYKTVEAGQKVDVHIIDVP